MSIWQYIIVNDYHTPPELSFGGEKNYPTDPGKCSAVVNDLSLPDGAIVDNCPNNLAVMYEITDAAGNIIACGFDDASGTDIPSGTNTLTYTVYDQPILLITEIIQDGVVSGMEITNFGPASLDISCLDLVRLDPTPEVHNVANGNILGVGDTYTHYFTPITGTNPAGYYIQFGDYLIDEVSMNGFSTAIFDFSGSVFGDMVYRQYVCDHDNAADWIVGDECFNGVFGELNPNLQTAEDNGAQTALQTHAPSSVSGLCIINISDEEAPFCSRQDTVAVELQSGVFIAPGSCGEALFNFPTNIDLADINLNNLEIVADNAGDISAVLVSPQGVEIELFKGLCTESPDVFVSLDDSADDVISDAPCGPLGNEGTYMPTGSFKDVFGQSAIGPWTLAISNNGTGDVTLEGLEIEFISVSSYISEDVEIRNDPGDCGAIYEWQHPYAFDNCCDVSISVAYTSADEIAVPLGGDITPGSQVSEFFDVGTTLVTYTLVDAAGNESQCSFEITVVDTENPEIDGIYCEDVRATMADGACAMLLRDLIVDFPVPTDNCGIGEIIFDPSLDEIIETGVTTVTITVIDVHGNEVSCEFDFDIREPVVDPSNSLACLGGINISLGASCMTEITADMLLAGVPELCPADYCIKIENHDGSIREDDISTPGIREDRVFTIEDVDKFFNVSICTDCDAPDANCCWGTVLVEQKAIPDVLCTPDRVGLLAVPCNNSTDPEFTGRPEITTCASKSRIEYEDFYVDNGSCPVTGVRKQITRKWRIYYSPENSDAFVECIQIIDIVSVPLTAIMFPSDVDLTQDDTCDDIDPEGDEIHPDKTGYPMIGGISITDTGEGLCSHVWGYKDHILEGCKGSYVIRRKWTVLDLCHDDFIDTDADGMQDPGEPDNPIEEYQLINVIDDLPPVMTGCPHDIVISNESYDCDASYSLKSWLSTIEDQCGEIKVFEVFSSAGSLVSNPDDIYDWTITHLPLGVHTVRVKAKDWCSNYAECSFDITVEDLVPPVVICDQHTQISLTNAEFTEVNASVFDDGTFDNCTGVGLQVYRVDDSCIPADLEPGDHVSFCCADAAIDELMVVLRAWDDADADGVYGSDGDNYAECMVEVNIVDKISPYIQCPADIVLDCKDDYTDTTLTGTPVIEANCDTFVAVYSDDISGVNQCNVGNVIRKWYIDGLPLISCTQVITLTSDDLFDGVVDFPDDVTLSCLEDANDMKPVFDEPECGLIGIQLESDTFFFDTDGCFKVLKHWTVLDWCQYDNSTDPPSGVWYGSQTIKVVDEIAPVITNCQPVVFGLSDGSCETGDIRVTVEASDASCGSPQMLQWRYLLDLDRDGDIDMEGVGQGEKYDLVLTEIPVGQHSIVWTVMDGCNNASSCTQQVEIRDEKAPSPVCISLLSVSLDPQTRSAVIWAADIGKGATDNCTDEDDLVYSFSATSIQNSLVIDCSSFSTDNPNSVVAEMYVTDESGNRSFCTAVITVNNVAEVCGALEFTDIAGNVTSATLLELDDVHVQVSGMNVDFVASTNTDDDYAFSNLQMYRDYEVTPSKDNDWLNGVSTLDIVMLQKHILGMETFEHNYKFIAGDINKDDKLSAIDLVTLRKLILGLQTEVPSNDSWRFMDKEYDMNPNLPFVFPAYIELENLFTPMMGNDFVGIKVGDISGVNDLNNLTSRAVNKSAPNYWKYETELIDDHQAMVHITATKDLAIVGFQTEWDLKGAMILDVVPGDIVMSSDQYVVSDDYGNLKISFDQVTGQKLKKGDHLFSLLVENVVANELLLEIELENMDSEIYEDKNVIAKLKLIKDVAVDEFILYQNTPNPFRNVTEIAFNLPSSQQATISVHELSGKVIWSITESYEKGLNKQLIDLSRFSANGVLYYQISTGHLTETKKMLRLAN